MIKIKGYEVRSLTSELLLKEFEYISELLNDKEKLHFEKWSDIFVYLGIPEEVVDEFDTIDFIEAIKEFNIMNEQSNVIIKSFEIDNITYTSFEDVFRLSVKEMSLIEGYVKKNGNRYLGEIMAVIYKIGNDKVINYDKSHIHHKAELFRKNIKADVAIPFINFLSSRFIKEVEMLDED